MRLIRDIVIGIALLCASRPHGQVVTTEYIKVQPIFMTDSDTGGTYSSEPSASTWNSFIADTQAVWDQASITILWQTPHVIAAATSGYLDLDGAGFGGSVTSEFSQLAQTDKPGANSDPLVLNMWFPRSMSGGINGISLQSNNQGRGITFQNGIAVSSSVFSGNNIDVMAHEIGHNLGLDHTTFGAGGADNIMTDGLSRTKPSSASDINPNGLKLDTLLGSASDTTTQIGDARLSGFVSAVPEPESIGLIAATGLLAFSVIRNFRRRDWVRYRGPDSPAESLQPGQEIP